MLPTPQPEQRRDMQTCNRYDMKILALLPSSHHDFDVMFTDVGFILPQDWHHAGNDPIKLLPANTFEFD